MCRQFEVLFTIASKTREGKTKPLLVLGIICHSDNVFEQFEKDYDKNFDILTMPERRRNF